LRPQVARGRNPAAEPAEQETKAIINAKKTRVGVSARSIWVVSCNNRAGDRKA